MFPAKALIPCCFAMLLVACGDDQVTEAPSEYDVGPTEETSSAPEPVVAENDDEEVGEPIVITVPSAEAVQQTVTETAEQLVEQVTEQAGQVAEQAVEVAEELRDQAAEQLETVTVDGQPVVEAAEEVVEDVATAITDQLNALIPTQPAPRVVSEVDWQSTYSAEVPFYNMGDQPVNAYDGPEGEVVIVSIGPGEGGYIETCNATLDWCALSLGDGSIGWVAMEAFGGVAN